jgi:hypothetical protein
MDDHGSRVPATAGRSVIDAFHSLRHYADHLRPVFDALPPEVRGTAYTPETLRHRDYSRPVIVASYRDAESVAPSPYVLVEHGAGMSYDGDGRARRNPSYSGGDGHERCILFLCHEEGTPIFDPSIPERGWHPVESHPTAARRHGPGLEVRVAGLPRMMHETVTPEHRYWARRVAMRSAHKEREYSVGSPHWIEAQHLDWNTWIGYPIDTDEVLDPPPLARWDNRQFRDVPFAPFYDPEFWWLVGLWWGDGTLSGNRKTVIAWSMSDAHPEVRERLVGLLDYFRYRHQEDFPPSGAKVSSIRTIDAVLSRWLLTWRKGNSRKEPPAWVERLPEAHQQQLLLGYFAADGCVAGDARSLSSIHLPGLLSVRRMLARQGSVASISMSSSAIQRRRMPGGSVSNCAAQFVLRVNDSTFMGNSARERSQRYKQGFIADGFLWSRVKDVEEVGERVFVPIQTETETYLTAYGRSHNCPSERVSERWRARYDVPAVVVGSPRLDRYTESCRVEQWPACRAHNPEVVGSTPTPATGREAIQYPYEGERQRGSNRPEGVSVDHRQHEQDRGRPFRAGDRSPNDRSVPKRSEASSPPEKGEGVLVPPPTRPTVAVTFHADLAVCPETRTAWHYYDAHLPRLCADPRWRVVGHGHPRLWPTILRRWTQLGVTPMADPDDVLSCADVLVMDNTSLGYEAAALGIPVVCLNIPAYRRDVEHGGRFWDSPPGVQVDHPSQLADAIERALADPPALRAIRERAVTWAYDGLVDGKASERAAAAILEVLRAEPV